MVILGIDPGVATVGFGIVSENCGNISLVRYGVISTPSKMRLALRLKQINDDVTQLIQTFKPDAIAVEELFWGTNQKTAVTVAQGRAAVILAGEERGIPMFEYTPLQVKKAVSGYGRATKKQVMEMVRRLLNMQQTPKPDDAADALAIAICHARVANSLLNINGGNVCSTI
ncbi:MAG: crossover junction endodeoxyribonuclease RuvC [Oscillospiraceae bacterium]|nr:crossover junction endodeoxyribonuclease RuvC [Oscillospiraceae bacterium]